MRGSFYRGGLILFSAALLRPISGLGVETDVRVSLPPPEAVPFDSPSDSYIFPNGIPGICQSELHLNIPRVRPGAPSSAPTSPPALAPSSPSATTRPTPKPRPRLGRITTDPKDKLIEAYYLPKIDLVEHDAGRYMLDLGNLIIKEWDNIMRAESKDWHPAVEVHFSLLLDPDKGVITVEGQSSPSAPELLARYRRMLESFHLAPFAEAQRKKFGTEPLRINLGFINVKTPAPTSAGK
jgi:hypothetical protein